MLFVVGFWVFCVGGVEFWCWFLGWVAFFVFCEFVYGSLFFWLGDVVV